MATSGSPRCRSTLPEILKASTELAAAKGDNGIGSPQGRVQAGAFEASAGSHLTDGFRHAGGATQTLGVGLAVAHVVTVGLEVVESSAGVFAVGGVATNCRQQSAEAARVKFLMSPLGPSGGVRVSGAIKSFGEVTEVLFGVEAIDDLPGLGK